MDHEGKLPMELSTNRGGSFEFNTEHLPLSPALSLSFHHLQPLSNELQNARVLACPADSRKPAQSFAALANAHISYWVNTSARMGATLSILAGDRNVAAPAPGKALTNTLVWTVALHRLQGNVLYGDGHVERQRSLLVPTAEDIPIRPSEPVITTRLQTSTGSTFPTIESSAPIARNQAGNIATKVPAVENINNAHSQAPAPRNGPVTVESNIQRTAKPVLTGDTESEHACLPVSGAEVGGAAFDRKKTNVQDQSTYVRLNRMLGIMAVGTYLFSLLWAFLILAFYYLQRRTPRCASTGAQ